jgi:hypothetical protein
LVDVRFEPSTASEAAASNCSKTTLLFDHLVGAREQRCWNFEAACIRHDEVDDEIEFDALLDRNIGAARFTASASDGSCRSICSNLSFRYTQVLNRDIGDDNR